MFERFTERARQVVVLAQDEARLLRHNYIGTEHLLLGLLREEHGLAARVLESLDITLEEMRAQVERVIGRGDELATGQIPFTPRAKKVLELSLREARSLDHNYIGTEHILLGVVRENDGVAARILLEADADAEKIRNEVIGMLSGPEQDPELAAELKRVRHEKEAALEAQEFERAAMLRDQERRLERKVFGKPAQGSFVEISVSRGEPMSLRDRLGSWMLENILLLVGAFTFGVGLLVGWLIWG